MNMKSLKCFSFVFLIIVSNLHAFEMVEIPEITFTRTDKAVNPQEVTVSPFYMSKYDDIYVPVSQTKGYINFKTKNFGETFRQVLIKVFSYNKKKDECLTTPEQEVSQPPVSPEPQGPTGPTGPTGPASSQEQEKSSNTKTGTEGV